MKTDVLRILNEIPGSNLRQIQQAQQEYVRAGKNEVLRYPTQVDLYESGLYDQYQNIYYQSVMIETYQAAGAIVDRRLGQEQHALIQVKQVMIDINAASGDNYYGGAPTLAALADTGLLRIQNILNSASGNGQFLFGGVNSTTPPCGDLVGVSNIVNGNITTNYTQTAPNSRTIKVSDAPMTVDYGIYAGMPVIAQAIGYLNNLKIVPNPDLVAADVAYNRAILLFDQAIANSGFQREKVTAANEYNDSLSKQNILTIAAVFQRGAPEIAMDFRGAVDALKFSYKISAVQNQTSDQLFQIL